MPDPAAAPLDDASRDAHHAAFDGDAGVIVLPDLLFDDTDTARAAREAVALLTAQEQRRPGVRPSDAQLVAAARRIASDDF